MDKCLLLVDQEPNVIRAIKRMCRRAQIDVVDTASGAEALKLADSHTPAVVLADQLLDDMKGVELFQKLKQNHPDMLRMMISAHSDLNQLTDAINNGSIFKFVLKPWDDEQLLSILEEAFYIADLDRYNQQLTDELKALNRDLEKRVEEKTRSLQLHVRSLNVTREIFNALPVFAIGISEDGLIVDANQEALKVLDNSALVGMPEAMLPLELLQTFFDWKEMYRKLGQTAGGDELWSKTLNLGARSYKIYFNRFETAGSAQGYLLSGHAHD